MKIRDYVGLEDQEVERICFERLRHREDKLNDYRGREALSNTGKKNCQ
jgi:hypothetical protein